MRTLVRLAQPAVLAALAGFGALATAQTTLPTPAAASTPNSTTSQASTPALQVARRPKKKHRFRRRNRCFFYVRIQIRRGNDRGDKLDIEYARIITLFGSGINLK